MHPRIKSDIKKIIKEGYKIQYENDKNTLFSLLLSGPKDSLYEGGHWRIRIHIPEEYPFKSPSVGFVDRILHPNIDYNSGSICLDVLNQTWSPIFNLSHIIETFLPQLLSYPNPDDPMNEEIAILMKESPEEYMTLVKSSINISYGSS